MKIDFSGGELGTLKALVFIRISDLQSQLVMADVHEDAFPSEMSFEQSKSLRDEIALLQGILGKIEGGFSA